MNRVAHVTVRWRHFGSILSARRIRRGPGLRLAVVGLLVSGLAANFLSPVASSQAGGRVPVIIIPGVAGSTFTTTTNYTFYTPDNGHGGSYQHTYGANETVWVNAWEAAFSGSDDYFDTLKLNYDANSPAVPYSALAVSGIYTDAYNDLIDFLHRRGYVDNLTLFTFAYDWRRDIPTATYARLDELVNRAMSSAGTSQVDLIGHSMGGLVARNYISSGAAASQKVRRLISFGTPYLGSPKFLKALLYGDQFGPSFLGIGLNPDEVKDLVQNMSGGWQLLPSRSYYSFYDNSNGGLLSPYREDRDVDGNGSAGGALSYNGLTTFLRNLGKNQYASGYAQNFHDRLDPSWVTGPRISFINGSGLATLGQIRDYTGSCWSWFSYKPCPKTDLLNVDGDGTVPYFSATLQDGWRGINLAGEASIHIVNREHGALVQYDTVLGIRTGDGPSLTALGQILDNTLDPVYSSNFATAKTFGSYLAAPQLPARPSGSKLGLSGYSISATDEVELEAVDAKGKHTGPVGGKDSQKYEQGIEGSTVDKVDGTQQVFLPENGSYTLRFTASKAGSFDLKIRLMQGDKLKQTAVYLKLMKVNKIIGLLGPPGSKFPG
jgi:pimeloyl-ACP methyl ester carboxylesterase